MKNNKGVSFLEVMICIAGIGLIILLYLQWVNYFTFNVANIKKDEDIDNAMNRVSEAFGSEEDYCNYILATPHLSLSMEAPAGPQVNAIDFHSKDGKTLNNVLTLNKPLASSSQTLVADIRLKPVAQIDPTHLVTSLEVTFNKINPGNAAAFTQTIRHLPILATVSNAGILQSCTTATKLSTSLQDQMCEIESDGFSFYDPVTKKCKDIEGVKWFKGTNAFGAQCPVGYQVAIAENGSLNPETVCDTDGIANVSMPARNYRSGFVMGATEVKAWNATLNFAASECTFVYFSVVPTAALRGQIKCFKK